MIAGSFSKANSTLRAAKCPCEVFLKEHLGAPGPKIAIVARSGFRAPIWKGSGVAAGPKMAKCSSRNTLRAPRLPIMVPGGEVGITGINGYLFDLPLGAG